MSVCSHHPVDPHRQAFAHPKYLGFASAMTTAIAGVTRSASEAREEMGGFNHFDMCDMCGDDDDDDDDDDETWVGVWC